MEASSCPHHALSSSLSSFGDVFDSCQHLQVSTETLECFLGCTPWLGSISSAACVISSCCVAATPCCVASPSLLRVFLCATHLLPLVPPRCLLLCLGSRNRSYIYRPCCVAFSLFPAVLLRTRWTIVTRL